MSRVALVALVALAMGACTTDAAEEAAALPTVQAPPPLTWNHAGYFIKGQAFALTADGANANGTAAFVVSAAPSGAPACPGPIAPECLDVPAPARVITTRPINAGSVTFNVVVPLGAPARAWVQVAAIGGGLVFKTQAIDTPLIMPDDDFDGDNLSNADEANIFGTDPLVADTDGDGLDDDQEVALLTDPLVVDTDTDGLSDGEEVNTFGTEPLLIDTDGGGESDGEEVAAGRDPTDPTDDVMVGGGTPSLIISEVVDHASFFRARFVEIYNAGDGDADLTGWALQRYSNGGTTPSNISFPADVILAPGDFYVVANSSDIAAGFPFVFSVEADQYSGNINSNGDDVYTLFDGLDVIDAYGEIGTQPGVGLDWNFADSVVRRNDGVVTATHTFDPTEWTITSGDATAAPFVR